MTITQTTNEKILTECAVMMCNSEPWITLNRDFKGCLLALQGDYKEVHILMSNDNELLGFAILQLFGTFKGYLQSICISPKSRNAGLGKTLIKHCEDRIFEISPNVFICVSDFNTKAADLYNKLGYEKIGELKNFIIDGYSEILFRKTIGSLTSFFKK